MKPLQKKLSEELNEASAKKAVGRIETIAFRNLCSPCVGRTNVHLLSSYFQDHQPLYFPGCRHRGRPQPLFPGSASSKTLEEGRKEAEGPPAPKKRNFERKKKGKEKVAKLSDLMKEVTNHERATRPIRPISPKGSRCCGTPGRVDRHE